MIDWVGKHGTIENTRMISATFLSSFFHFCTLFGRICVLIPQNHMDIFIGIWKLATHFAWQEVCQRKVLNIFLSQYQQKRNDSLCQEAN